MEPEFITYRKFNDPGLAEALAEQLRNHGIMHIVEEQFRSFDPTFTFNKEVETDWAVKIKPEDFELASEILKEDAAEDLSIVDKDYYLFTFTDEELMEVISKADEWSAFDFVLARKLLAERGHNLSDAEIETISNQRTEELKAAEPNQSVWILIGYMCAFMGGILGIFIGWFLKSYKKTLPDGERVYGYNENDRRHGRNIFVIGIAVTVIFIVTRIVGELW